MNQTVNTPPNTAAQWQTAQEKFASARSNLLLMIALTAVNMVLLALNSNTMLLFSATIPYITLVMGLEFTDYPVMMGSFIALAAAAILLYLLCWWMSKKHYGWMIAALVMFILDTAAMALIYVAAGDFSGILDIAIHAWVMYYLIIGVKYGHQLHTLPEPIFTAPVAPTEADPYAAADYPVATPVATAPDLSADYNNTSMDYPTDGNSPIRRRAETDVKFRVLLQADAIGHHIVYRRVKKVNELIVDRYVYDEVEMLIENAHELTAQIDGHTVQVGYDGAAHSYLKIDGEVIAKKMRLY